MNLNLDVQSWGIVSPGGTTVLSLEQKSEWPAYPLPRLKTNRKATPINKIDLQSLAHWQREPRLRRATPMTYFLTEAVDQCLKKCMNRDRLGLIVINFTGSITYSRRFYQEIVEQGPRAASPMMFPETVFNSPASHVVAQHKIGGPVYSLLGDETAWIAALETAALWLQLGKADEVIVAAGYEIDAMSVEAYHAAGWIRKGMIPTEGAAALSLRRADPTSSSRTIHQTEQGFLYRTKAEFLEVKSQMEKKIGASLPTEQILWNPWTTTNASPRTSHAFGVSIGWETIQLLQTTRETVLPVFGCNHQAGFIRFN